MEHDAWKWLTTRKLVIFIIVMLVIYVTLWTLYFLGYFPEVNK